MPTFFYVMNNSISHRFSQLKNVTDYILSEFSHYIEEMGGMMIHKDIVADVAKFSHIIGRMENYLVKQDVENFELMENWLKIEMESREYVWEDFIRYINFSHNIESIDLTEEEE